MQIFVIHVRGSEDRRRFIEGQLKAIDYPVEYVLDGNKEDLTPEILDRYFMGKMHGQQPNTSCAYKHILTCKYIVERNLDGALIIEDDLRLYPHFQERFERSISEYQQCHSHEAVIINYEESSLLLVPRSERRKGQMLYQSQRDRFAGCIYINNNAARIILQYAEEHKSSETSDRLHTLLVEQGLINYYWSHPCLACQCSCDGSMPTMIPTRPRPFKRLKWFYKRLYKHMLYWFR